MKLTFDNIQDFDDFKQWFASEADNLGKLQQKYDGLLQHSKELEQHNYELEMENRKLKHDNETLINDLENSVRVSDMIPYEENATATNSDE